MHHNRLSNMKIDISTIIKNFASLDKAGKNSDKIDTYLEYHKLGEYLNGNLNTEGFESYDKLEKSQQNLLLNVYQEAKKYLSEHFAKKDNFVQITDNNIEEYKKIYNKLNRQDTDNAINNSELQELDSIKKGLFQYCKNCGYDLDDCNYDELDYGYVLSRIKERQEKEAEMRQKGQVVLDRIKNPYDNNLLKSSVEKRVADENIQDLDPNKYTADLGNGVYDKTATQKTELCWAHAGINSLNKTETGKNLLSANKYYDPKTGVFAIHLQEAEDNGLHGGIYVITPDEIESEGKNLSEGEGDVTVWMIAIKRYFEEINQNPELLQKAKDKGQLVRNVETGNAQFRFFEIITGAQSSRKDLWDSTNLQVGVSYGKNDITFADMSDLVSNKKGAAVICIGGHAMSVVGIKDDKLLIQESNNSENLGQDFYDSDREHALFEKSEPIDGKPTYELTKDDFEHYNFGEGVIKWE